MALAPRILARLVEQLLALGATVVAFDFVLPHTEPDLLSTLPEAIKGHPNAVAPAGAGGASVR